MSLDSGDYKAIVEFIVDSPGHTGRQIASGLGLKPSLVNGILSDLEKRGTVYTSKDDGALAKYFISGRVL